MAEPESTSCPRCGAAAASEQRFCGRCRPEAGAVEIAVPLTQEELAAMIGAARASVNRLRGFYEDRGVIARRGRRIAVLKPEVLRNLA